MTLFTSVLLICVLIIRTFVLNYKRYFFNFPPAAPGSGYPQKDPLHFLPPGQYLSEPLPPEAGLVDADADYNEIMNDSGLGDGSIILMHDIPEPSVKAALRLIPDLIAKGYKLVTVSEMAEAKNVTLQNVCYVDFWQSTLDSGQVPGYQGGSDASASADGTDGTSDASTDSSDGSEDYSDGSSDSGDGSTDDSSYDDGSYDDGSDDSGDYSDDNVDYGDGYE